MIKNESYEFLRGYENNHINIGFGSYGQVKLARNIETKELVAIKLVRHMPLQIYNKNAKDEIMLHRRLDHPSIIKLLNYYYEKEKNITYMVLEYADGGTLFERIKSSYMSKEVIRKIFRQICQGVAALHANNVMHRDIKPENILLTKKNDVKLCDFGFAALVGERKTLCGTYEYMAPEMVQGMPYDFTIDIWALGILLFEMVAGVAPFRGESPEEVLGEMKRAIFFSEKFDKEEINLIKHILRVNPSKRPQVTQILEHPYFEQEKLSIDKAPSDKQFGGDQPEKPERLEKREIKQEGKSDKPDKPIERFVQRSDKADWVERMDRSDKVASMQTLDEERGKVPLAKGKINDSFSKLESFSKAGFFSALAQPRNLTTPPPIAISSPLVSAQLYNPLIKPSSNSKTASTKGSQSSVPQFRSTSTTLLQMQPNSPNSGSVTQWRKT